MRSIPLADERVTENIPTVVYVEGPGTRLGRERVEQRSLPAARIKAKAAVADPREVERRPRNDSLIVDMQEL